MKVVFHEDFYQVYTGDPAAASGRIEAIVETIGPHVEFVPAEPALCQDIAAVHTEMHTMLKSTAEVTTYKRWKRP
jgi:hypothetical protein